MVIIEKIVVELASEWISMCNTIVGLLKGYFGHFLPDEQRRRDQECMDRLKYTKDDQLSNGSTENKG